MFSFKGNPISSIQSEDSGPLFDGDTEPAPPSPQQCLILLSLPPLCGLGIMGQFSIAVQSGGSGPLFDGARSLQCFLARPAPFRSSGPPFDGAVSTPSSVFWTGAHPTPSGPRVDAILTRCSLKSLIEEMRLSLYTHMTIRGTQNCSRLKVGAIGETWLHSCRMRGGSILPKSCRKCGRDTQSEPQLCTSCGASVAKINMIRTE